MIRSALEATAYHEAGHAVIAFVECLRIKKVDIVKTDERAGCVERVIALHGEHPDFDAGGRVRRKIEKDVMVCVAGGVAQRLHRRSSLRSWHLASDYRFAVDLLSYLEGDDVIPAHLKYLEVRVEAA